MKRLVTIIIMYLLILGFSQNLESAQSSMVSPDKKTVVVVVENKDGSRNIVIKRNNVTKNILKEVSKVEVSACWSKNSNLCFLNIDYGTKGKALFFLEIKNSDVNLLNLIGEGGNKISFDGFEIYALKWEGEDKLKFIDVIDSGINFYICDFSKLKAGLAILKLEKSESIPKEHIQKRVNELLVN